MTRTAPTYTTTDLDVMTGIYNDIREIPQIVAIAGIVEGRFFDKEAPEAAARFRQNATLQNFLSAKRTVYRLFREVRDRR